MSALRPTTFKIVQLNAENLFLFLDDQTSRDWRRMSEKEWQTLTHATVANKSLTKTLGLADSILHMDADLVGLNEVGGEESLTNFAKHFLHGKYVPHLIEGNSNRGIDIGYLVKKDCRYRPELRSHKTRPLDFMYPHERQTNLFNQTPPERTVKTHYFSRDCAELRLYAEAEGTRPALIVLLVHLKSKLDPDGIDPQGKERRRAELETLVKIYQETRREFSPPVPIVVLGDFNGSARRDKLGEEFRNLMTTDLESVLEIAGHSGDEAITQMQINRSGHNHGLQIDFIFISPELKSKLITAEVGVYRYLSDLRVPLPLPTTLEQRLYLPSDHYPVFATFRDL